MAARLQNPTAFVLKLFSGKSNFRSIDQLLIYLNAHRYFDGYLIILLWKNGLNYNPKQAVDGYLKKSVKNRKISKISHTHRSSVRDEALVRQELLQITCFPFKITSV